MRLWSIHPKYLDSKGLVALWREALLAQKVLTGRTRGYKNHPQLERFKNCRNPISAMGYYLLQLWKDSKRRGYNFDKSKIFQPVSRIKSINVTDGQMSFEFDHLKRKLRKRDAKYYRALLDTKLVEPHPLFSITSGKKADWEK